MEQKPKGDFIYNRYELIAAVESSFGWQLLFWALIVPFSLIFVSKPVAFFFGVVFSIAMIIGQVDGCFRGKFEQKHGVN